VVPPELHKGIQECSTLRTPGWVEVTERVEAVGRECHHRKGWCLMFLRGQLELLKYSYSLFLLGQTRILGGM
jgi:hypothetical protein